MIAIDPQATFEMKLPSLQGMPDPPVFRCRFLTARKRLELNQILERAAASDHDEEALSQTVNAVSVFVADWTYKGQTYTADDLTDYLTQAELSEVILEYLKQCVPSEVEVKKSLWRQHYESGNTVASVPAAV